MKRLAFLSILLMPIAFCVDAEVRWSLPTAYLDGSPMPITDIESVTILWWIEGTAATGTGTVPPQQLKMTIATPCGVYHFVGIYKTTPTAKVPSATQLAPEVAWNSGKVCIFPLSPGNMVLI